MRIIVGKAKSGKTRRIYDEIRSAVANGQGMQFLVVPEQYSHEAERELCRVCGPSMSLSAEVMSFTGLSRWANSQFGGAAENRLNRSGQILCMAVALRELKPVLNVYAAAGNSSDMQLLLCREIERMAQSGIEEKTLRDTADRIGGSLAEKLKELALLSETAEAIAQRSGATIRSPLEQLAFLIEKNGLPGIRHVYFDGFFDFTGLELKVIFAMLRAGVEMTFCLPGDSHKGLDEHFLLSRLTVEELQRKAEEENIPCELIFIESNQDDYRKPKDSGIITNACKEKGAGQKQAEADNGEAEERMLQSAAARRFLISNMFRYDEISPYPACDAVVLLKAKNPWEECEIIAGQIWKGIREDGLRWRDFAVAIRGFEEYGDILEDTFKRYEIPLFLSKPTPLAEKLFPVWLQCAYEVVTGHWETDDLCAYLRCGLNGFTEDDIDLFCSYLQKWNIKKADWERTKLWKQHPDGYDQPWTKEAERKLCRINKMRGKIWTPLYALSQAHQRADTGRAHILALIAFLNETKAGDHLLAYAEERKTAGKLEIHAEALQSWELCTQTLEQFALVGGSLTLSTAEFRDLLFQLLTQVDLSIIPVALDRVPAGDFHRIRKRNIRRLFVLGCSDDRLPGGGDNLRLFSEMEMELLSEYHVDVGCRESELWREYAMMYHTFTLPSERLTMSFAETNKKGENAQPAFIYSQIAKMFKIEPQEPDVALARLSAYLPALGLAARAAHQDIGEAEKSAAEWFQMNKPEMLEWLNQASGMCRKELTRESVEALYGKQLRISPSHMEQFMRCRFAYYCRYGLRAKPDDPAAFQSPEVGSFFHYVLQHVLLEIYTGEKESKLSKETLRRITERQIKNYVNEKLGGLEEKSARFQYLFERMRHDALLAVEDVLAELSRSDFKPLSFELDVSAFDRELSLQNGSARLTGVADRVDGWEKDGRLFLRIIDYKTGKKQFQLSDVLYGLDSQMLVYLFLITDASDMLYKMPGASAGISYLPLGTEQISFENAPEQVQMDKERKKRKRRSGILLDTPAVKDAWERGKDKTFLPAAGKDSSPFVSSEQMEILRRNVMQSVLKMAEAVQNGSIQANPIVQSGTELTCENCDYKTICQFAEGKNGEHSVRLIRCSDEEAWRKMGEQK